MIFLPSVTVLVGHSLLGYLLGYPAGHSLREVTVGRLAENLLVAFLLLVLVYIFAETLFRVLGRLQAEALSREQDMLTMNAVMQERERLSRELHDGVAQLVADLLLRLDTIKELVEADRQQEAGAELERLHSVANEIYEDIGESITGLRTNVAERGLVRALQDYVDQFEERHQIPVSLQVLTGQAPDAANRPCNELVEPISHLTALQLFRLVQEALTNVRKHAGAREATVTLISDGSGQLKVVIADDGRGFNPGSQRNGNARTPSTSPALSRFEGSGRGLGLTSMRERVEAVGGTFHVNSQPGSGTQVTATIPIPPTRRENGYAALATPAG
jgi:two-component system sensor histidine kinase DegS